MNELRSLGQSIWVVDQDFRAFGVNLGIRMTIVRLEDGSVWVHSPIKIDDDLAAKLESVGPVKHIVAPSRFHHMFAIDAHTRWPEATLWVSPGLVDKFDKFAVYPQLQDGPTDGWPEDVQVSLLDGIPAIGEAVFYHTVSKSMVVSDFFMHTCHKRGFATDMLMRIEGVFYKFNVPRLIKLLTKDKTKLSASLASIAAKPVDRIIMAHGDVIEEGADLQLKNALGYLPA